MIGFDFYKNREHLDNEFKFPNYDVNTGKSPEEIAEYLDKFFSENAESMPACLLRSKLYEYLFDNARIEINPYNIFAGKIEYDSTIRKTPNLLKGRILGKLAPGVLENKRRANECASFPVGDYHHTLPDWNDIVHLGFFGILRRAENRKAELEADPMSTREQLDFIDSVIIVYSAIIRAIGRMHEEAKKYDGTELFVSCTKELLSHEPRSLYEVLMTTVFFSLFYELGHENSRSLGRLDVLYAPYYHADIESGKWTAEELKELLRYFLNVYSSRGRNAGQPICLGGSFADGSYIDTELTEIILDVYDELDINDPKIHIRYNKSMPDSLLKKILGMIRHGHSSFAIVNDEIVFRGYERIGIDREESQYYLPQGCYESTLMGLEEPLICCSWVGIPKAVELALGNGYDMITGNLNGVEFLNQPKTYEEFFSQFIAQLDAMLRRVFDAIEGEIAYQNRIAPCAMYSGTVASCIERARDVRNGGMKYNNTSIKLCGIGTAVDSLLIVKKYVYDEGRITLSELAELMKNNWAGGEELRLEIMKERNRYGNGLPEPDMTAKRIYDHIAEVVIGRRNNIGGVYRLGADSVMHCVKEARSVAATPDGRFCSAPFSRNLCSVTGMDKEGVTGTILSTVAMDHSYFVDGGVCDFVIHPSAVEGERGMEAFATLARTYFELGGMVLQGNVFSLEDLYAAQKDPEKYSNLQVRVCGWNEYFVRMEEHKQNEFIARCRNLM